MSSKKIVLSADGTTATVAAATFGDVLTTMFSTDSALTGPLKFAQTAIAAAAGAVVQKKVDTGAFGLPFTKPN